MGTVTSVDWVYNDGSTQYNLDFGAAPQEQMGIQVEFNYGYSSDLWPKHNWINEGMWRYRGFLPLDDGPILYPLPVGGTPLLQVPELRRRLNLPGLFIKDETRGPTGSNKDRATALVLEQALRLGIRTVTCASTGNVATSLSMGAAASGLQAVVFVPEQVSAAKLQFMLLGGATVFKVAEGYEAAFRLSRQAAQEFGWMDRNTGVNPVTLEAKKTVAFEIWEQLGGRMPDVAVAPVGDGPTLCALAKGFRELVQCGLADKMPRILGVQAAGCQPVKQSWEQNQPVQAVTAHTLADGIAVGNPVSGGAVLRDVRESHGAFVAVSDDRMLAAIQTLAKYGGIWVEPAGAAAFAGLQEAITQQLVTPDETVVVMVTGSGLKTPQYLQSEGRAIEVKTGLDVQAGIEEIRKFALQNQA
ncbi:threonine synthase [Alicyclobacillaceae bacterium I2511]|nr:threonine synthase [Alicyclobacillaceae bacterium I2511]